MHVLAAGSLRGVWPQLVAHFSHPVDTQFGPAGLLRERIEAGEPCDLFASANVAHPQALFQNGRARSIAVFASNTLCLTARSDALREGDDWLSLLTRPDLRLATSTAVCDPSGDYTQELFTRMGDAGVAVRERALALVGGREFAPVPPGKLAAEWIIQSGQADLFIGYGSYAPKLRLIPELKVLNIPAPFNPRAEYACAVMTPEAENLAEFLQSEKAKAILQQAGFGV